MFTKFNKKLQKLIKRYRFLDQNEPKDNAEFRTIISGYSDEQLVEVLKKRNFYKPEAAEFAIEEAIRRRIIFSEQDLLAQEYRVEELSLSLFPSIKSNKNRERIRKSIARSLVICGILPVVYGLLKLNGGKVFEGSLILFLGLLWIFCSSQLIKFFRKSFALLLMVGACVSLVYVFFKLISLKHVVFMDYFISAALFFLVIYGLFLLIRIHRN